MPYEYIFQGIIHPERVKFTLSGVPKAEVRFPELNLAGVVDITAVDSVVSIVFRTEANLLEHPQRDILVTLKNDLGDYTRLYIDTYCYTKSFNYDLEISKVQCLKLRIDKFFDVQLETDLEDKVDLTQPSGRLNQIVNLVHKNPRLFFLQDVFADFRRGIKYPKASGFFFYRALDSIRESWFDGEWEKMNKSLGFSEEHYKNLNSFRKKNAHGVYPLITGEMRVILAKDTRRVIDSFLCFMQNSV